MSRTAHFGIGIGAGLFCCAWCVVGQILYMAAAFGGASVTDVSFIATFIFWGGILLGGVWFAFRSFRRALRPLKQVAPAVASPPTSDPQHERATPDEKLAHLLKKPCS